VGTLLILWPFAAVVCGVVCAHAVKDKQRSRLGWFLVGCIFGPIGVLVAAVAYPLGNERRDIYRERP